MLSLTGPTMQRARYNFGPQGLALEHCDKVLLKAAYGYNLRLQRSRASADCSFCLEPHTRDFGNYGCCSPVREGLGSLPKCRVLGVFMWSAEIVDDWLGCGPRDRRVGLDRT